MVPCLVAKKYEMKISNNDVVRRGPTTPTDWSFELCLLPTSEEGYRYHEGDAGHNSMQTGFYSHNRQPITAAMRRWTAAVVPLVSEDDDAHALVQTIKNVCGCRRISNMAMILWSDACSIPSSLHQQISK